MSKVTDLYNAVNTRLESIFSSKKKIPNPYSLEDNNDNLLTDSYGLKYGIGTGNIEAQGYHFQTFEREIVVVLTRKVYRTENNNSSMQEAQLAMLEDQKTLIVDMQRNLNGAAIEDVQYTSDSGIENVFVDKNSYLTMSTNFAVTYVEDKSYCI